MISLAWPFLGYLVLFGTFCLSLDRRYRAVRWGNWPPCAVVAVVRVPVLGLVLWLAFWIWFAVASAFDILPDVLSGKSHGYDPQRVRQLERELGIEPWPLGPVARVPTGAVARQLKEEAAWEAEQAARRAGLKRDLEVFEAANALRRERFEATARPDEDYSWEF